MTFEKDKLYVDDTGVVVVCTEDSGSNKHIFFGTRVFDPAVGYISVCKNDCFIGYDYKPYPFALAFVPLENQEEDGH